MKKKVDPKVMNMIHTGVLAALPPFQTRPNVDHSSPCREARGEPQEDARHGAEGQGEIKQTMK